MTENFDNAEFIKRVLSPSDRRRLLRAVLIFTAMFVLAFAIGVLCYFSFFKNDADQSVNYIEVYLKSGIFDKSYASTPKDAVFVLFVNFFKNATPLVFALLFAYSIFSGAVCSYLCIRGALTFGFCASAFASVIMSGGASLLPMAVYVLIFAAKAALCILFFSKAVMFSRAWRLDNMPIKDLIASKRSVTFICEGILFFSSVCAVTLLESLLLALLNLQ
ncbi:MAG: hypothetical protein J5922_04830 [Clostridia bacterium]|nr:hypothetical protein [Clostridia bacterium]